MSIQAALDALSKVQAPGFEGESIVALGYVRDLDVTDGCSFRLELPTPLTPSRRALPERCREALSGFSGEVKVTLESRVPATFQAEGQTKGLAPGVKNFIAVGSGKGGVGKSTIAANLAIGLAQAGASVGLLDADVYGPSVPLMFGTSHQAFMEEMELQRHENPPAPGQPPTLRPLLAHGVHTMSIGYLIDPDQAAIWRGPMVHGAITQLLRDVEWGELDYMVIDLPPGTGDVQLSLTQNLPLAGAVIVCTPQPGALADARKALNMFTKTSTECLGIVQNMAFHACASCGHEDDIFGSRGAEDAAEEWGVPFLGSLPLDRAVRISGDEGRPVLAREEPGALGDALWATIDRITAVVASKVRARPRTLPISRS